MDQMVTRDHVTPETSPTRFLWLVWAIWLAYLSYPLSGLFDGHPSPARLVVTLAVTAIFVFVYLRETWRFAARRALTAQDVSTTKAPPWLPLAILVGLALAISLGDGQDWLELFIYASALVGVCLPFRPSVAVIVGLALMVVVVGRLVGADWSSIGQADFVIGLTGFSVLGLVWLIAANRALRMARAEIARLAVSEERLRFARDLHDLLGHSLSLIALKSELAGRLAVAAPEQAAAEMRDVESVARTALQEVRGAVAGYRRPTLAGELRGAQEILTAAGIAYGFEGADDALPAPVEAVLSWAVREGVTNVIRHSRARHCAIRLVREVRQAILTVTDDGRGSRAKVVPPGGVDKDGSGLAGLAERAAALGGLCEHGPLPGGGFRLRVSVPLEEESEASRRATKSA